MKKDIKALVDAQGYPAPVAAAVLADIDKHQTGDKIASGELKLPSVEDASAWHEREHKK